MLALIPSRCITSRLTSTLQGTTKIATSSLRACSRKKMHTSADDDHFLDQAYAAACESARSIKSERSYAVLIMTPGGRPFSRSASFALAS